MLLGRFEWTAVIAATAVVATIVSWHVAVWSGVVGSEAAAPSRGAAREPSAPTSSGIRPAGAAPGPAPQARVVSYRLVAARGASWLQVRERSHAGRILFEGTLASGESRRFHAGRLWLRFGAAANVDLHIDGALARQPLFGTYDAFVTPGGVRADPALHEPPAQAAAAQSP